MPVPFSCPDSQKQHRQIQSCQESRAKIRRSCIRKLACGISKQEHGAGVIADCQKVPGLLSGYAAVFQKFPVQLGSHGVSAEKPAEHNKGALF